MEILFFLGGAATGIIGCLAAQSMTKTNEEKEIKKGVKALKKAARNQKKEIIEDMVSLLRRI